MGALQPDHAMAIVDTQHVEKPAERPARLARLPRIRVAQIVMDYLAHGWTAEDVCRQYPHLMPAEVHAAMTYYYDHRAEVDAEIREELDAVRAARTAAPVTPFELRMGLAGARDRRE
jgi:hypothetical protein